MRDIGPVSWWRQWLHFFTFSICLSSHLIMAQLRNFLWNIFQIFWVIFTFFQISIKETVRWWLVCAMAGISFRIPGMDGMELSRLTNGVANLTVVLQEVIPEVTRSFVRTLDTVTNVILLAMWPQTLQIFLTNQSPAFSTCIRWQKGLWSC